jgi:hypothetical protein
VTIIEPTGCAVVRIDLQVDLPMPALDLPQEERGDTSLPSGGVDIQVIEPVTVHSGEAHNPALPFGHPQPRAFGEGPAFQEGSADLLDVTRSDEGKRVMSDELRHLPQPHPVISRLPPIEWVAEVETAQLCQALPQQLRVLGIQGTAATQIA